MKKYALISVSDKNGIEYLAKELISLGYEIISTGGTANYLLAKHIPVIPVSDVTGFPEIMDGRVKTLHPFIHGGILAERDKIEHVTQLKEKNIPLIDIVVVNLYPFAQTVANPNSSHADIIENIDIGGPAMIRSAAKNYRFVTVLTDPIDYKTTLQMLKEKENTTEEWRLYLASKAYKMIEEYDRCIASYFEHITQREITHSQDTDISNKEHENIYHDSNPTIPPSILLNIPLLQAMRYGENPHQMAGFYANNYCGWNILHGKPMSFNNMLDFDAAIKAISLFDKPTVIIFKHTNPCGIGSGENLCEAYKKAFATDPISPFGGIVIVNKPLDLECAKLINEVFTEIIIAPEFPQNTLELLKKKKDRRLVLFNPSMINQTKPEYEIKTLSTGYLLQTWDNTITTEENWKVVTKRPPNAYERQALRFAWKTVAILKSNAIALTTDNATIGLGMGQTSRVDSTNIAISRALTYGHDLSCSVCASDGFFPFKDSIELLDKHGIKAVIQPGGSKGDEEVIEACNEKDITMIFTGKRHFRH